MIDKFDSLTFFKRLFLRPDKLTTFQKIVTSISALIAIVLFVSTFFNSNDCQNHVVINVLDLKGFPINKAKVSIFYEDEKISGFTETDGTITLSTNICESEKLNILVQKEGYHSYQATYLVQKEMIPVRLEPNLVETTVFRITDENNVALSDAELIVIIDGETLTGKTDDKGIAKLKIYFKLDRIDVTISLEKDGLETKTEKRTLVQKELVEMTMKRKKKGMTQGPLKQYMVTIYTEPENADIFVQINGRFKFLGKSHREIKLPEGECLIKIRHERYEELIDVITVPKQKLVTFKLNPLSQN